MRPKSLINNNCTNVHTLGLPEDPLVYIIIAISSGAGGQAIDVTGPTTYTLIDVTGPTTSMSELRQIIIHLKHIY